MCVCVCVHLLRPEYVNYLEQMQSLLAGFLQLLYGVMNDVSLPFYFYHCFFFFSCET